MTGVRREWLGSNDFVMVHLDLIDTGLSWEAAGLLHRIHFRSGGEGWWYATKEEMQADMRMTEWKLRRAVDELRNAGLIAWERQSAGNATLRWRVVFADAEGVGIPHSRDGGFLIQETEDSSVSSIKNDKKKDSSSPGGDGGGQQQPTAEQAVDAAFDLWWDLYPRKVARKDAKKAYEKALRAGVSAHDLTAGLRAHLPGWEALRKAEGITKIPHPATWLNGGRWEDRPDGPEQGKDEPSDDPTAWMKRRNP